ncbi:hypothetical protein ACH4C6_10145 [Streptomyces sp. NPDC017943]|uniref:hypothetical protein n=1 Tax=Streptomyces sp. NPDC017943 TaxID=3365019 RepID=UPI003795A081
MHPTAHHIAILVHDGVKLLDLPGPTEVFEEANRLGADYRIRPLSPTGEQVTSPIGIRVAVVLAPPGRHSLTELAGHLNTRPRHLTRLFRDELSTTPARYVESIRFDLPKSLLDQGHTATRTARKPSGGRR